jgi:hypothetical protein
MRRKSLGYGWYRASMRRSSGYDKLS